MKKVEILRPGGVSAEDIAEITGYLPKFSTRSEKPEAPGMLNSHYAPKIPLIVGNIAELTTRFSDKKLAVITFSDEIIHPSVIQCFRLFPSRQLHEAAHHLFAMMHDAENSGADIIISELLPETGIGRAINDRLKRAAF